MASKRLFKNRSFIGVLGSLTILLLSACGAEHPFARGKLLASHQEQIEPPIDDGAPLSAKDRFRTLVRPHLLDSCLMCHEGAFVSNDADAGYLAAKALITSGSPDVRMMFQKVQGGLGHGGGALWSHRAAELTQLKAWIEAEAP
jgi:hypothetical protein